MESEKSEAVVAAACDALLDRFVIQSEPRIRKAAEMLYDEFLTSVQEYLKSNAHWNLANEIDRCRRTDSENRDLRAENARLQRKVEALSAYANIHEMCLYTLSDGRINVQDRTARLPGHSFSDEVTARIFALGYLYGLNPRAMPDELSIIKINAEALS